MQKKLKKFCLISVNKARPNKRIKATAKNAALYAERFANKNNTMKKLANVIIVLILVVGCSNESQHEKESPIGHSWILTEIAVNGGELVSIPRYANYFWSFKEKPYNFDDTSTNAYIEGDHWCNWFYVFINIAEAGITFSPFTLFTPTSCSFLEEDGALLNVVETKILSLHTKGNIEYEIIDDFMSLYTEDGTTLVFQRVRS